MSSSDNDASGIAMYSAEDNKCLRDLLLHMNSQMLAQLVSVDVSLKHISIEVVGLKDQLRKPIV